MGLRTGISINVGAGVGSGGGAAGGGGAAATQYTLNIDAFIASGTWTSPAALRSPAGVDNQVLVEAFGGGGGGTTDTAAGGGGAYSADPAVAVAPSTGYAVVVGAASAANVDGTDTTFAVTTVVAKAGLSGTNGGTGGTAAASTGVTKFSGGNGGVGTGTRVGGGGAGATSAGVLNTPGIPDGGLGSSGIGVALGAGGGSTAVAQSGAARGACRISYDSVATAGYPRVRARSRGRDVANAASRAATMPGSIAAGDLLIAFVASDGIPAITASGWTALTQINEATSQVSLACLYKVAAGADTLTIATDASEMVTYEVYRIENAGTPSWTTTQANGTNANPAAHAPVAGSAKYLWLVALGIDGTSALPTAGPSGYSSPVTTNGFNTTGVIISLAQKFAEAASDDPGTFTHTTEQWACGTLSVPPA